MAIGQTGIFDPRDFKNMVREIAELNKKVEEQGKDARIDNLIDLKQRKDLFGVSARNLEEFKEARKGIKNQRDALEKLREEFGEGITETKRYRKIEERLRKEEIKANRSLKTPLSQVKEQAKDAAATTSKTFQKYLGRDSYFGKTMSGVVGIFQSIGGFLTRQTATISKILGAGLTVAALFGLANFLESETFKNMIPKIKASIERIVNAFSEGGILEGLKQIGRELKLLFDNILETTGFKKSLENFQEKFDNFAEEIENIGRETLFASAVGATFLITRKLARATEKLFRNFGAVADEIDDAAGKAIGAKGATRKQALTAMAKDEAMVKKFAEKGIKLGPTGMATDIKTGQIVSNARIEEVTKDFLTKGVAGTKLAGFMKAVFKVLPFASAAYMGYQLKGILESKDSKDDKIQQMGGLIGGTLGATGLGALGGMLGAAAGPLGILGGIVTGSLLGGLAGDVVGREMARYLLGEPFAEFKGFEPVTTAAGGDVELMRVGDVRRTDVGNLAEGGTAPNADRFSLADVRRTDVGASNNVVLTDASATNNSSSTTVVASNDSPVDTTHQGKINNGP